MLGQRRSHWPNIKPVLGQDGLVWAGYLFQE